MGKNEGAGKASAGDAGAGEMKKYTVSEHKQTVEEVAAAVGTHIDPHEIKKSKGLSIAEAKARLEKNGPNMLKPKEKVPEIVKFLLQFTNLLIVLLIVAAILTFIAYAVQTPRDNRNVALACILVAVIILTCAMSYWQEHAAESVMNSLLQLIPTECAVIRDGVESRVKAIELVLGDVVRLGLGDRVPADMRIIASSELKVETSSLTGETDAIGLDAAVSNEELPTEARNLAFMSSLVMTGEGWGVVIRTGDDTMIGSIASLATATKTEKSTLQIEVKRFAMFIAGLAIVTGVIFFIIALATGLGIAQALVTGLITVLVANVPEGLPATVTTQLTVSADRMRKQNVLVKRMDMIETLGSVTVIASDKTGTLTQNRMTVENLWVDGQLFPAQSVSGAVIMAQVRKAQERSSISRISQRPTNRESMSKIVRASMRPANQPKLANVSEEAEMQVREGDYKPGDNFNVVNNSANIASRISIGRRSVMTGEGSLKIEDEVVPAGNKATSPKSVEATSPGGGRLARLSQRTNQLLQALQGAAQMSQGKLAWGSASPLERLITIGCINNEARPIADSATGEVEKDSKGQVKLSGNATDQGILRYCMGVMDVDSTNRQNPITFRLPFNSVNKFAITVCNAAGGTANEDGKQTQLMLMKGAPEYVIKRCKRYLDRNNTIKDMDEAYQEDMMAAYERCGLLGERVIGLAFKEAEARNPQEWGEACKAGEVLQDFVFTGLISLVDPPKVGVMEAVLECRTAGIRVVMVTGDHPLTAEAIARKVGIITKKTPAELSKEDGRPVDISDERARAVVIPGSQIVEMTTEEQWDAVLTKDEIVFARTTPQQKLEIVSNLQRLKEVVAVTGDGVNDSPALKRAQVGVAMGSPEASDVARDAASVILLDDNFASIVTGIREGRILFDNLVKTVTYTVTHLVPELFPIFFNIALGFPLPLSGLLIVLIDLITEQAPAISLAYEPAEASVMERPPRDMKRDRLASWPVIRYAYLYAGMWESFLCLIAYLIVFWQHDINISKYVAFAGGNKFQPQAVNNRSFVTNTGQVITADDQVRLLGQAQAAWWLTLIMCQFWHIWICKTRFVPIARKAALEHFKNTITWYGLAIEFAIIILIVYVPGLQGLFGTSPPPGAVWVVHFGFPLFMLPLTDFAKHKALNEPNSLWAKWIVF